MLAKKMQVGSRKQKKKKELIHLRKSKRNEWTLSVGALKCSLPGDDGTGDLVALTLATTDVFIGI